MIINSVVGCSATVSDKPGGIATLARDIADIGVSVKVGYNKDNILLSMIIYHLCISINHMNNESFNYGTILYSINNKYYYLL